ncbi:MAG: hypothetical protein IAE99_02460 [Rhodothermales bacterium]|nr:hypothetical protein [Rhodothermales bacterium]
MRRLLLLLFALAVSLPAQAQRRVVPGDSLAALARYSDTLDVARLPPYRLRPFIRPQSVTVKANGQMLPSSAFTLDARNGRLELGAGAPFPLVQLVVGYETWGVGTDSVASVVATRRSAHSADSIGVLLDGLGGPVASLPNEAAEPVLRRSGSITRGVLAGTNRDVTLESGLKLSLDGEIAPGVHVEASLNDANTPILVEGTTQRLSEFDRLYLTVTTKGTRTRLGDVDLSLAGGELVRLTRRVQGAAFDLNVGRLLGGAVRSGRVTLAGAAPRGQFRLQEITPLDGVQGPYRLDGAAGEPFILIVPGSEVVYLDGQRLVRGRDDGDYWIEYATGELFLTPRRLLRREQRLSVEFQYTANRFSRSLLGGRAAFDLRLGGIPLAVGTTFLREADGLELGEGLDLTPEDSALLRTVGGGLTYRSGATRLLAYDPEATFVQYRLDISGSDSVFVALDAAPSPDVPVFRVRFTRVGTNAGRYVRDASRDGSGVAFRFVGTGQGDYEPTRLLPKPRAQQLAGLDVRIRPFRRIEMAAEWARSDTDENRFAPTLGQVAGQGYTLALRFDSVGTPRRGLAGSATRRFRQEGFQTFDRTRPVDFTRRWNLMPFVGIGAGFAEATDAREALDELDLRGWLSPQSRLAVEAGRLELSTTFAATRAALDLVSEEPSLASLRYRLDAASSDDRRLAALNPTDTLLAKPIAGGYVRGEGRLERSFGRWTPGIAVLHEWRTQRLGDSLLTSSLGYAELRPGLRYDAGEAASFSLDLVARRSWLPMVNSLVSIGDAFGVSGGYRLRPSSDLTADGRFEVRTNPATDVLADELPVAVAMQHDVRWSPLRSAVVASASYIAQSERMPRLQEIFLRVTPDLPEARYVWTDRNGNGVKDLDEFLPETTPYEGTYARAFLPTDSLDGVASVQARFRLSLDPSRLWRSDSLGGWRRWLRQVSARTTLDVDDKNRDADPVRIYALDPSRLLRGATTLSGRMRVAQELSLGRGTRATLDLGLSRSRSLSRLSSGVESRTVTAVRADTRYRIRRPLTARLLLVRDENDAASDRFATRRYRIRSDGVDASLAWSSGSGLALTGGAAFASKTDREADRSATLWRVPVETRWVWGRRLTASATVEAAFVTLRGDATGEAAYELTEGRGPGRSVLWSASVQAALSRVLTLTAGYDGRAPQDAPLVQTLRVQLSAAF